MREMIIALDNPGTRDAAAVIFEMESDNAADAYGLKTLAKNAAAEYAMTDEGARAYEASRGRFNWGDLADCIGEPVFTAICESHGLSIGWVGTVSSADCFTDLGEFLMDDLSVTAADIKWDTDGVSIDDLPEEVTLEGVEPGDDIADRLSDEYGYCVESYTLG